MKLFDNGELLQNISRNEVKEEESLVFGKQKITKKVATSEQFFGYNQNNQTLLIEIFKKDSFKYFFIITYMHNNDTILHFFQEIYNFVQEALKTWGSFTDKAIYEVIQKVKDEISIFNSDFNQICYEMLPTFMSEVFSQVIDFIWREQVALHKLK